jgi:hypothetical protein
VGLVVEPDRRMRVIGGQGVIMVQVDPRCLSYEDDVFAVRNVALRLVPPQDWIGPDHRVVGNGAAAGPLTVEGLVRGLEREVGAGGKRRGAGRITIRLEAEAALTGRLHIESDRGDA